MPMPRTMVVAALVATLTLGTGGLLAAATPPLVIATTTTVACPTASLAAAKSSLLSALTKENANDIAQRKTFASELSSDKSQLAKASAGSELAHSLAGTITILNARLSILGTDLTSIGTDVTSLAVCSSARIATAKKHVTWRKLVTQRALVQAELSVATSDLAYRRHQLAVATKAKNKAAEKTAKRLIAADKSQIKVDRSELTGIAKELAAL